MKNKILVLATLMLGVSLSYGQNLGYGENYGALYSSGNYSGWRQYINFSGSTGSGYSMPTWNTPATGTKYVDIAYHTDNNVCMQFETLAGNISGADTKLWVRDWNDLDWKYLDDDDGVGYLSKGKVWISNSSGAIVLRTSGYNSYINSKDYIIDAYRTTATSESACSPDVTFN